jgi:hypothetical protein
MRDIRLSFVLDDDFVEEDYVHEGDFIYIFENDNKINDTISTNSKVYKTLNGAKSFRLRSKSNPSFGFRYPIRNPQGGWIYDYNNSGDYYTVIIDITDKWNNLIDGVIDKKTEEFNKEIKKWESKKSTQ